MKQRQFSKERFRLGALANSVQSWITDTDPTVEEQEDVVAGIQEVRHSLASRRLQGCTAPRLYPYTQAARQAGEEAESRVWGLGDMAREECHAWRAAMERHGYRVDLFQRDIKAGGYRLPVVVAIATKGGSR